MSYDNEQFIPSRHRDTETLAEVHLTDAEREALHSDMAAWAEVMPYNHLGPEYGLSDGIWTRLDKAVERILAARIVQARAGEGALRERIEAIVEEWADADTDAPNYPLWRSIRAALTTADPS